MNANRLLITRIVSIGAAVLVVGSVVVYAAIVMFRFDATSNHIGLQGGPALVTARVLNTPVGEITGGWPPSLVSECRDGGWRGFNHPAPFANQGACIAYVNNRKRITLLVPEDPIP